MRTIVSGMLVVLLAGCAPAFRAPVTDAVWIVTESSPLAGAAIGIARSREACEQWRGVAQLRPEARRSTFGECRAAMVGRGDSYWAYTLIPFDASVAYRDWGACEYWRTRSAGGVPVSQCGQVLLRVE